MRRFAGLAILLCVSVVPALAAPAPVRSSTAKVVIVFKDGHRQAFNLADIARIEFPAAAAAAEPAPPTPGLPARGRFLGKWMVGDGSGSDFYIVLKENGEAWRSLHSMKGRWMYVDGEARITWDDGAQDAIRKVGPQFQKFAYHAGKSFTDVPDNVTNARNTNPQSI